MPDNDVASFIEQQLETLLVIQAQSKALKDRFNKVEKKTWEPSTVAGEIGFQLTHLLNSIMRHTNSGEILPIGPFEGIDKGLEDESADVLFNLMSLANLSGMNVKQAITVALSRDYSAFQESKSSVLKVSNIIIQAGELWDAIFRREGGKPMSREANLNEEHITLLFGGVMICLLLLVRDLNVDMYRGFREILIDSGNTLDRMGV